MNEPRKVSPYAMDSIYKNNVDKILEAFSKKDVDDWRVGLIFAVLGVASAIMHLAQEVHNAGMRS